VDSPRRMVLGKLWGDGTGSLGGQLAGTTMFFSHYDGALTQELVSDAGLLVERAEVLQQDNEETEFLWITARKP
jgi:hypothetical protein